MPATSKRQFKLMVAIKHGAHIPGVKLSPEKAAEFVDSVNYKSLSEKQPKRKWWHALKGKK